MPHTFTVTELASRDLATALPLLRATWAALDLAVWRRFAATFSGAARAKAGITGLYDEAGGLCGLFAWQDGPNLFDGPSLTIPLFTVMDIGNSMEPVRALVDAAEARRSKRGCTSMKICLATAQSQLAKRLRTLGGSPSETVYSLTPPGKTPRRTTYPSALH